jgi:hypothetical protein
LRALPDVPRRDLLGATAARLLRELAGRGVADRVIYGEVARVPELRKIPHFRLMTDDAQVAFKEWAASLEKIRY